jgi:hypothetical protein
VTWLNPKIGFEVSSAAGFTFNWENPDTDYTTAVSARQLSTDDLSLWFEAAFDS